MAIREALSRPPLTEDGLFIQEIRFLSRCGVVQLQVGEDVMEYCVRWRARCGARTASEQAAL